MRQTGTSAPLPASPDTGHARLCLENRGLLAPERAAIMAAMPEDLRSDDDA